MVRNGDHHAALVSRLSMSALVRLAHIEPNILYLVRNFDLSTTPTEDS